MARAKDLFGFAGPPRWDAVSFAKDSEVFQKTTVLG
jgi:hypothetical protein